MNIAKWAALWGDNYCPTADPNLSFRLDGVDHNRRFHQEVHDGFTPGAQMAHGLRNFTHPSLALPQEGTFNWTVLPGHHHHQNTPTVTVTGEAWKYRWRPWVVYHVSPPFRMPLYHRTSSTILRI